MKTLTTRNSTGQSAENVRGELGLQGDIRVTHTLQGSGPVAEKGAERWQEPEVGEDQSEAVTSALRNLPYCRCGCPHKVNPVNILVQSSGEAHEPPLCPGQFL